MPDSDSLRHAISRRRFFRDGGLLSLAVASLPAANLFSGEKVVLPFINGERQLATYPQKRPLILLTSRPPQLETPFSVFNEGVITPNDAFFVRYHLSDIPLSVDPDTFRLEVRGLVDSPLTLSLADLKRFEPVEVVAVCQCSGNSRAFSQPRVAGGQLGHGAMGNAKWRGVRLKDVLAKAGLKGNARQIAFNGLDQPVVEKIPDFVKSLDLDHALDGEVMLAYEMNGEPLPMLNGFPLRLVVPGYFGTYWVKHVNEIKVIDEVLNTFWMNPAYRIPDNGCGFVEPGSAPGKTTPITRFNVRSFITNFKDGDVIQANEKISLKGIAFDGGNGIREILYSINGGKVWRTAKLEADLGKYSFREWKSDPILVPKGKHELKVRAINRVGETQPLDPLWNPAGYMRNVVETVRIQSA